ncbi:MAG: hypothetical protein M1378_00165 [Bacteroidetes bacterium]|nr:hypothetical protein [Bacteroidota bacterium]
MVRFTKGKYIETTEPMGVFRFRYAVFRNQRSEVLVPVHDLTPETKKAIREIEQSRKPSHKTKRG